MSHEIASCESWFYRFVSHEIASSQASPHHEQRAVSHEILHFLKAVLP
nr:MAG TPA: hypothetical protein [Caudoviricetes sp.]